MSNVKEVLAVNFPQLYVNQNVTVKFQLIDRQSVAQIYPNRLTIEEVKDDIGGKFKVLPKYLTIKQGGIIVPNALKLYEIWRNDFGIIELELNLNDLANKWNENVKNNIFERISLDINTYYSHFHLPEYISVHVPQDGDEHGKQIIVEIVNKPIVKPFLGGYRDKRTGIEYHDAFSQTGPAFECIKWDGVMSRDTQTIKLRHKCDETHYDSCTQCFGDATKLLYVPETTDYIIETKKFETYDEMCRRINKLGKIKLIQRNFRRHMWEKFIKQAAAEWRRLCDEQKRREYLFEERVLNRFKKDCTIKTFPKTREDFDMLYAQVQFWKDGQIKTINEMYSGGPRIAELHALLDKEIQMLNGIEKQRLNVKQHLEKIRTNKQLEAFGAPIKRFGYKNQIYELDLLCTQRARRLNEYYKKLLQSLPKTERLELIEDIFKLLEKENNIKIIDELQRLFNREKELLLTCTTINDDNLKILREQQLVNFIDLIKDDEDIFYSDDTKKNKETKICVKCENIRHISEFILHTQQNEVNICKSCAYLKVPPIDLSIYRAMLRAIRRDEKKYNAIASYAFIIQEEDIREIIENIWHGHSILSQCDVRKQLRLPRWKKNIDWSPWNCICLTEEEYRVHIKFQNLNEIYDQHIINDISNKHQLAKITFKKLKEIDNDFKESKEWRSTINKDDDDRNKLNDKILMN